ELPEVVLTTESVYKDAMVKAIGMSCKENAPLIVSNAPNMWDTTDLQTVRYLPIHYGKLANAAIERMIEVIENKDSEPKQIIIEAEYIDNRIDNPLIKHKNEQTLRLLMMENAASAALKKLLPGFERQTGCKVEMVTHPYGEIYNALCRQKGTDEFDIKSIDIPWVREFAEEGEIEPLSNYLEEEDIFADIPRDILETYAKCGNEIYGYPYNFCIQLLFYRKDFFADIKCRSLYYEMYKRELKPPRTWKEFNDVARFFTRRYNPYSPTEYGTTLGSCLSSGATCEFLPRLWGMGGSISENGRFTLDSKTAIAALENYADSFKYAPHGSENNWWPEQAEDYRDGKAAMMMLFADNTYSITEYDKSQAIGKTGYALMPDKASTLGGWVFTVNSRSKNKKLAWEFLKWSLSKNISLVGTVLGGFVPNRTCLESTEITNIYPWTQKLMEGMKYSCQRKLPKDKNGHSLREPEFEAILGRAVYDAVTHKKSPRQALTEANKQLNDLLKRA
ncbi:MAG: sugar ABC transporter substrate-binding protein, partial [Oscillospiraceae bacterium]|nr:sugar ABC transporter substrate-binding protein [Oscillospiraceae bacterium]